MKIQNNRDNASRAITNSIDNWADKRLRLLLLKSSMPKYRLETFTTKIDKNTSKRTN